MRNLTIIILIALLPALACGGTAPAHPAAAGSIRTPTATPYPGVNCHETRVVTVEHDNFSTTISQCHVLAVLDNGAYLPMLKTVCEVGAPSGDYIIIACK